MYLVESLRVMKEALFHCLGRTILIVLRQLLSASPAHSMPSAPTCPQAPLLFLLLMLLLSILLLILLLLKMLLTLLLFIELFLLSSHKPCSLCKESREELIFFSFLNETASVTARISIEVGLPSCSAPRFIQTRDCLWQCKEHKVGALTSGFNPCYIMAMGQQGATQRMPRCPNSCSSLHYGTRLLLEQQGAKCCLFCPFCPR